MILDPQRLPTYGESSQSLPKSLCRNGIDKHLIGQGKRVPVLLKVHASQSIPTKRFATVVAFTRLTMDVQSLVCRMVV
jgi:hypothetical protein